MKDYKPHKKTAAILDRAYEMVQAVPYPVSSRWLFYRLLQEGFYSDKNDYINQWMPVISKARKRFYNGWTPFTLEDDTRQAFILGDGFTGSLDDWIKDYIEIIKDAKNHNTKSNKWQYQDYYIELWFEARAMYKQFAYYTKNIPLVPMAGQASIPHKWECAKRIEGINKPVIILYFGDLDKGGDDIAGAVETDVMDWCSIDFTFVRCGLTMAQVHKYDIPERIEKPGYQWEALTDSAAREIITEAIKPFYRHDGKTQGDKVDQQARALLQARLDKAFK